MTPLRWALSSASTIWIEYSRARASGRGPRSNRCLQRLAVDVLHHQVVDVVLHPDVVERADVWMVQAGNDEGFAIEAFTTFRVVRQMLRQRLDRDGAVQARVERPVHLSHAARGDECLHFVGTEGASHQPAGRRRLLESANRAG